MYTYWYVYSCTHFDMCIHVYILICVYMYKHMYLYMNMYTGEKMCVCVWEGECACAVFDLLTQWIYVYTYCCKHDVPAHYVVICTHITICIHTYTRRKCMYTHNKMYTCVCVRECADVCVWDKVRCSHQSATNTMYIYIYEYVYMYT